MTSDEEMTASQPSASLLFKKPGPKPMHLFSKNRPKGFLFNHASDSDINPTENGTPTFLQRIKHRNPFALTPDANAPEDANEEMPEVSTPTPNAIVKSLPPSSSGPRFPIKPLMIDFKSSLTTNAQVTPKSNNVDKDLWTNTPMSGGSLAMQPPSPRKLSHGASAAIIPYSPTSPELNKENHLNESVSETSMIHSSYELDKTDSAKSPASMSDFMISIAARMKKEEQDFLVLKEKHEYMISEKEHYIRHLRSNIQKSELEIGKLRSEKDGLIESTASLKAEAEALKTQLSALECDKIELSSDIKGHRLKITELEEFVSMKKLDISKLEDQVNALNSKIEALKEEGCAKARVIDNLQKELHSEKEQKSDLNEKMALMCEKWHLELKTTREKNEENISLQEKQFQESLNLAKSEHLSQIDIIKLQLQEKLGTIEELEKKLEEAHAQLECEKKLSHDDSKKAESLENILAETESDHAIQIQILTDEKITLESKLLHLQNLSEETQKSLKELKTTYSSENCHLTSECDQLRIQVNSLEKALSVDRDHFTATLGEKEKMISSLQSTEKQLNARLSEALEILNNSAKIHEEAIKASEDKLNRLFVDLETLKTHKNKLESENQSLKDVMTNESKQLVEWKGKYQEIESKMKDAKGRLNDYQSTINLNENEKALLKQQLGQKDHEIQDLKGQVAHLKGDLTNNSKDFALFTEENECLRSALTKISASKEELEIKLKSYHSEIERMKNMQQELSDMRSKFSNFVSVKNAEYENSTLQMSNRIKQLEKENEQLKSVQPPIKPLFTQISRDITEEEDQHIQNLIQNLQNLSEHDESKVTKETPKKNLLKKRPSPKGNSSVMNEKKSRTDTITPPEKKLVAPNTKKMDSEDKSNRSKRTEVHKKVTVTESDSSGDSITTTTTTLRKTRQLTRPGTRTYGKRLSSVKKIKDDDEYSEGMFGSKW